MRELYGLKNKFRWIGELCCDPYASIMKSWKQAPACLCTFTNERPNDKFLVAIRALLPAHFTNRTCVYPRCTIGEGSMAPEFVLRLAYMMNISEYGIMSLLAGNEQRYNICGTRYVSQWTRRSNGASSFWHVLLRRTKEAFCIVARVESWECRWGRCLCMNREIPAAASHYRVFLLSPWKQFKPVESC